MGTFSQQTEKSDLSSIWEQQLEPLIAKLRAFPQIRMSTLGPEGTSSEAAAQYLIAHLPDKQVECTLYPTYEEAFEDLVNNRSNLFIVANAYQGIDQFYMSLKVRFLLPFVFETPLYGVAAKLRSPWLNKSPLTISTHHAPSSLIPWFLPHLKKEYELIPAHSTSEAARKVQRGEADLCITTANACRKYGLEFISRTRRIVMLWSVFIPENIKMDKLKKGVS
ncbi:prephenate dehydratase domain-containing protein [Desmospora profundinema]|uniref:Bacilysin biosynthesis protein BacA n=1 Tax=Desmospora profundinema TaxID=1571184 RepID=A0ABU1IML3_9BACL|nr:prephenate dehydratase domain-containing protein [Desmospora profundinema]MDR6226018.1 bacilysin biosynthesis protein BacA [Desmospora profundinema]